CRVPAACSPAGVQFLLPSSTTISTSTTSIFF
ncbi:unnamed protein product, partial [Rotaria sp. Silwood2]